MLKIKQNKKAGKPVEKLVRCSYAEYCTNSGCCEHWPAHGNLKKCHEPGPCRFAPSKVWCI